MSDANTHRVRAARARIRAAATLLRDARGLDSMSVETEEKVRLTALDADAMAAACSALEREMNRHVATWNKRRKAGR